MATDEKQTDVRFKLPADAGDLAIWTILGRFVLLKKGTDDLYDAVSWHTSERKAEQALVQFVTRKA